LDFTLYESGTTRSARCRWTLLEAGIDFKSVSKSELIGSDEIRAIHPLAKLPVAVIDGEPLFESAAICTFIADQFPENDLIAKPGSWARAQHDQWVSFALTEMEAWLWNTAVNLYVLPPDKRIDTGFNQNAEMFKRGAQALNDLLSNKEYLIENQFSVTDIIVGWTVNWGRRQGLLDGLDGLQSYLRRLLARPYCALAKD
tara:strand:+ start:265 stop:864 length:600 start_codon:yes stop_codon:yes gene_type:complete